MYYLYFPYVVLLGIATIIYCHRQHISKLWGVLVIFAPVTTPYVIYRAKRFEGVIFFMMFMSSFSMMLAGEIVLYKKSGLPEYTNLPPITRKLVEICDILQETTQNVDYGIAKLERLSRVTSTPTQVAYAMNYIPVLRQLIGESNKAREELIQFTTDHQSYLVKKDLKWVYHIRQFYTHPKVIRHDKSLDKYLNDFETMLTYASKNFHSISDNDDTVHVKNYDQYYFRYRRSVDTHILYNNERIKFQDQFSEQYPEIKPYLPGIRPTNTFRLIE